MADDAAPDDDLGLIDYLALEFPGGQLGGDGFRTLLDLVDADLIRVLDLEFVSKAEDGTVELVDAADVPATDGFDPAAFDGAASGLVDADDLEVVGSALAPGSVAALLVYEERTVLKAVHAWERHGARRITDGHVTTDDLVLALDASEHG